MCRQPPLLVQYWHANRPSVRSLQSFAAVHCNSYFFIAQVRPIAFNELFKLLMNNDDDESVLKLQFKILAQMKRDQNCNYKMVPGSAEICNLFRCRLKRQLIEKKFHGRRVKLTLTSHKLNKNQAPIIVGQSRFNLTF